MFVVAHVNGIYHQGRNPFGGFAGTYHPRLAKTYETQDAAEAVARLRGEGWSAMKYEEALAQTRL